MGVTRIQITTTARTPALKAQQWKKILAATAVYSSLPQILRGRRVIHFIDNTSAISCLLHGYSGKPDSALLVNAFHLFNAGLKADIHFEYVESKATYRRVASSTTCAVCALAGWQRNEWSSSSTRSLLGLGRSEPSYWRLAVRLLRGASVARAAARREPSAASACGLAHDMCLHVGCRANPSGCAGAFPTSLPSLSAPRWANIALWAIYCT